MNNENSLFSLLSNIKDKINSFFSSVYYNSKKNTKKLEAITKTNNTDLNKEKNNLDFLLIKASQRKKKFKKKKTFNKGLGSNWIEDNLSNSLSTLSSNRDFNLNYSYSNENNNSNIINLNNNIQGENYFKNNYRLNNSLIGQKRQRNYINDDFDSTYSFNSDNINKEHKIVNNNKKSFKKINSKKKWKNNNIINYNDIRRLSNDFHNYKKQQKIKKKINDNFLKKIKEKEKLKISDVKEENKKTVKLPFTNLYYTHPQRFSFYSTQKKLKLDNESSKKKNKELSFSISFENNINIISSLTKENKENILDKKDETLNLKSISCDVSNIINTSNEFTFRESNDIKNDNDINLSKLLDENNCYSTMINTEAKDINNSNCHSSNILNNCANNEPKINTYENNYMDLDEFYLLKNDTIKNNNYSHFINSNSNINQITTNSNPFLKEANIFFSKTNTNVNINEKQTIFSDNNINNISFQKNEDKSQFNINGNIFNKKPFFEGKNLFNINENNNTEFQFSFGKN